MYGTVEPGICRTGSGSYEGRAGQQETAADTLARGTGRRRAYTHRLQVGWVDVDVLLLLCIHSSRL